MELRKILCIFILSLFVMTPSAFAYKTEVHALMTDLAARQSVLANDATWQKYGFQGVPATLPLQPYKPESKSIWSDKTVSASGVISGEVDIYRLMAFGADVEDTDLNVVVSRALNHFFNPQTGEGLALITNTSPDWILEDRGSISSQNFSYRDAQENFYIALTAPTEQERLLAFAKTIQTLGHVVHHIQDMAQPQHTRIDPHCDSPACDKNDFLGGDFEDTSVYEIYTHDIIACGPNGNSKDYGPWGAYSQPGQSPAAITCNASDLVDWQTQWIAKTVPLLSYAPVEAVKLLPAAEEVTPRDFWTNTNNTGLADFSSQNFITSDTSFDIETCDTTPCKPLIERLSPSRDDLPLPDGQPITTHPDGAVSRTFITQNIKLSDLIQLPSQVPSNFGNGMVKFLGLSFKDRYAGETVNVPRMATYSIFNERFTGKNTSGIPLFSKVKSLFTVNYFNLDDQAKALMPRAVGYSTGLINHFFGHRLNIDGSRPMDDGVKEYGFNNGGAELLEGWTHLFAQRLDGSWEKVRFTLNEDQNQYVKLYPNDQSQFLVKLDWWRTPDPSTGLYRGETHNGKIMMLISDKDGSNIHAPHNGLSLRAIGATVGDFGVGEQPVEPVPCGSTISAGGGSEGYSSPAINLGSVAGTVQIRFEAYEIPDGYQVTRSIDGAVMAESDGLVSGYYVDSFLHSPNPDNPETFLVGLDVTGNTDDGTAWQITLGCPGNSLPDKRKTLDIEIVGSGYLCQASLYIDGQYSAHLTSGGGGRAIKVSSSPGSTGSGSHTAELRDIDPLFCTSTNYLAAYIRQNGVLKGTLSVFGPRSINFRVD